MRIKIRDWDKYFEADRSRQWKSLKWVPVPNKQGLGYKKIMSQKNGAEIFGCWSAIIQQASLCDPRGDLSKYTIEDISIKTMINTDTLNSAILFIVQNLDWIEVIEDIDKNVNVVDGFVSDTPVVSSILFNSILSYLILKEGVQGEKKERHKTSLLIPPSFDEFEKYCTENNHRRIAKKAYEGYSVADWHDSRGKKIKNWKQKLQHVWFRDDNEDGNRKETHEEMIDRLRNESDEERRRKLNE